MVLVMVWFERRVVAFIQIRLGPTALAGRACCS